MKPIIYLLIVGLLIDHLVYANDRFDFNPIAHTKSRIIIGQKVQINDDPVYQFLGVPYAEPPLGSNRFERPKSLNESSGSRFVWAQKFKPTCMQMKHLAKAINPLLDVDQIHEISEDCLYLNIYVPIVENDKKIPVMVWLPGEGFDFADARQFSGAYLASIGKVIVVTVQYRVGVFGFLKDNAGLWDQLEALRWINENIEQFNGDPNDVTLFGRFTGSMSISILLSSPEIIQSPKPLFNRAILMSGIAVGQWVFNMKNTLKANKMIDVHDCGDLECLKSIPAETILEKSGYGWKPTIESDLIIDEPLNALQRGQFPKFIDSIMLGSNQFEGSLCLLKHLATDEKFYLKLIQNNISSEDFDRIIREDLQMFYGDDQQFSRYRWTYQQNDRDTYLHFCSELLIESHMRNYYDSILNRIQQNPRFGLKNIYRYKVDYKPKFSIAPGFINSSIHGDDVLLAFGLAFKQQQLAIKNQIDQQISNKMIQLFSRFAIDGQPPSDSNHFIEIKSPNLPSAPSSSEAITRVFHPSMIETILAENCRWTSNNVLVMLIILSIILFVFFMISLVTIIRLLSGQSSSSSLSMFHKQSPSEQIKHLLQNC
ncbi:Carboxylesterase 4A [Sarcoptes scabiei]|uniref:Carboxylesterase 4A n=1 Tax=Sarcoptes scabiei TaxID=52283 RepID=A0A834RAS5_SARSC|nr:Carboxylesterase 4A [Sarcoptes scabiei]